MLYVTFCDCQSHKPIFPLNLLDKIHKWMIWYYICDGKRKWKKAIVTEWLIVGWSHIMNGLILHFLQWYWTCELKYCAYVQRRTRGLIIWSSGSVLWVYRGRNYEGPIPSNQWNGKGGDDRLLVTDVSLDSNATSSLPEKSDPIWWNQQQPQNMTPEEAEFDRMLDDFGPRFVEWWGTGILPVDADLLPPKVTGYKAPLRLLPAGMRSRITEDELTKLRKLSKALPCHFALGKLICYTFFLSNLLSFHWHKSCVVKGEIEIFKGWLVLFSSFGRKA